MTASKEGSAFSTETADAYGRRTQCFVDHKTRPFNFKACVSSLKSTIVRAGENKLLNQLTLNDLVPLQPIVFDADPDFRDDLVEACLELPQDPAERTPPLFQGLDIYKKLLIPTEPLALVSDPETDFRRYSRMISEKRFGQHLKTWMPLAQISRQKDGESPSSPRCQRLRSLLQRELDSESVLVPDGALVMLEELQASGHNIHRDFDHDLGNLKNLQSTPFTYPEPVTPPILESSDEGSPYIPLDDSNIIDLTSPPTSPRNEQEDLLREAMEAEQPFLDAAASNQLLPSSPSHRLPDIFKNPQPCLRHLEADMPVLISSDSVLEEHPLKDALPLLPHDSMRPPSPDETQGFFDDAFESIIQDRASYVQNLAEQENFDSLSSKMRVQVPILNFKIPETQWANKSLNARNHFQQILQDLGQKALIEPAAQDFRSKSSLRWNPVPSNHNHIYPGEEFPCPVVAVEALLEEETPDLDSANFLVSKAEMAILKEVDEMEIDIDDAASSSTTDLGSQAQSSAVQPNLTEARSLTSEPQSGPGSSLGWSSILGSMPTDLLAIKTNLLPRSSDTSATSALVSSFMQLRGQKPISLEDWSTAKASGPIQRPQKPALPSIMQSTVPEEQPRVPAPIFQYQVPKEMASFVISLGLSRSLISHLEAVWPASKLIDLDFSRHNSVFETSRGVGPTDAISTLSIEADIVLSPSVGIIVTNLLKVKQRALPGTKTLPPLRERIWRVSEKYEMLFVLVSECNATGEFASTLNSSDAASYADLVHFAATLNAGLEVVFVPGAEATLCSWILGLMSRFSSRSAPLARFITPRETSWELLLRQAGFNVIAAKVLAGSLLEDAGPSGLARYTVTPVEERVAAFRGILGGEKVIRSSSARLDRKWS